MGHPLKDLWICPVLYPTHIFLLKTFWCLELDKAKEDSKDIDSATEQLKKQLHSEKLLKTQAVNKLAEIMNRKDFGKDSQKRNKVSSADLRKKEKECKKLHQELALVRTTSLLVVYHWHCDWQ